LEIFTLCIDTSRCFTAFARLERLEQLERLERLELSQVVSVLNGLNDLNCLRRAWAFDNKFVACYEVMEVDMAYKGPEAQQQRK